MDNSEKIEKIKNWLGSGSINIFGRPFSGKDYQCRRLVDIFGGNIIGAGDIFRSDSMPEHIKECMRTGKLVPTKDFVEIILNSLNQPNLDNKPLLLSSVGRWHGEEPGVIEAVEKSGHPLKAVVYIDLSEEDVLARWNALDVHVDRQGRYDDDSEEVLKTRFAEFREKTFPVLDYYKDLGMLLDINGNGTRDEVAKNVFDALYEQASKSV